MLGLRNTINTINTIVQNLLLDKIKNSVIALGADKLISTYNGYNYYIRRSSDNAKQFISFSGNDIDILSMLSFCSGGNGFIERWYRQDGSNEYFQQTDNAKQPQIVKNGYYMGGVNFPNGTYLDGGTISAFSNKAKTSNYVNLMIDLGSNGRIYDKNNKLFFLSNTNLIRFWQQYTSSQGFWENPEALELDTLYDILLTYSGLVTEDPKIYVNNTSKTVNEINTPSGTLSNDSSDNFTIGNRAGLDRQFRGTLNRVICWADELTSNERSEFSNYPYTPKTNGIDPTILLVFDDTEDSVYDIVHTYIQNQESNVKFTTSPVKNWVGATGINGGRDYATLEQLQTMYNAGHDIISHTETHANLTGLSESGIADEINNMRDYLNNNSMPRGKDFLIYPYNAVNETVLSVAEAQGLKLCRGGNIKALDPNNDNQVNIGYLNSLGQASTTENAKNVVDDLIKYNAQGILFLHAVKAVPDDNTYISTEVFEYLIDYLDSKSNEIRAITISQWYDEQYT